MTKSEQSLAVIPALSRNPATARLRREESLPRSRTWSRWTPDQVRG